MLPPDARTILTEALRPPPGSVLERAVALTFTLDLESALVVPLAFAAHAARDANDPLTVMESVRACASKVDIFCQAGQIRVPAAATDLHAFLEEMVHPVERPRPGRLFHPKLLALRYRDVTTGTYPARVLVLSRNLTSDRSWDACLRLDGTVTTAIRPENRPLVDLIRHSMSLAIDLPATRREGIEGLVEDLRRVEWEPPEGASSVAFHAFGIPRPSRVDFAGSRHLVVSPFCNAAGLSAVAPAAGAAIVSKQEDLDRLPEAALEGHDVFVINELAGLPPDDADPTQGILTGLHAKLYVVENGWDARLFVGSANATDAAFGGNTELLVELTGKRKSLGVDTMMGPEADFRLILERYNRQPAVDVDEGQRRLENFLRDIAATALVATVQQGGNDSYELHVTSVGPLAAMDGVRITAELITRRGEADVLSAGLLVSATFVRLATVDITPFLVVRVTDEAGNSASTIVRCSLVNDPLGRLDEILARQVDTPEKFLRFLALLLGLGFDPFPAGDENGTGGAGSWTGSAAPGVLELLMRGLVDQPKQLSDLARLVERLTSTERGRDLLPSGFADLWAVVDVVRRELATEVDA